MEVINMAIPETKLGTPVEGVQEDADLAVRGYGLDQAALLEIVRRREVIIVEQPVLGKTVADEGVKVTKVQL